jgi:hypothetical protein
MCYSPSELLLNALIWSQICSACSNKVNQAVSYCLKETKRLPLRTTTLNSYGTITQGIFMEYSTV